MALSGRLGIRIVSRV